MENKIIQQPTKSFSQNLKLNTIREIVLNKDSLKSIAVMRKENNLFEVKVLVTQTITEVFKWYKETYTPEEIEFLAESSMRIGYMLNGEDFNVFKQKAQSGEYKNRVQIIDGREFKVSFFKLTPDVYLDWFQEYIYQRGEAFANNSHQTHKSTVKESSEVSPEAAEKLKEIADRLKPNETEKSKPMEESKEQKQAKELQSWLDNEFGVKWKEQGSQTTNEEYPKPFIEHKGYFVLKFEYIKARFEEIHKDLSKKYESVNIEFNEHDGQWVTLSNFIYEQIEKLISNGKV